MRAWHAIQVYSDMRPSQEDGKGSHPLSCCALQAREDVHEVPCLAHFRVALKLYQRWHLHHSHLYVMQRSHQMRKEAAKNQKGDFPMKS